MNSPGKRQVLYSVEQQKCLLKSPKFKLTNSFFTIRHVRGDYNPPPLSHAQPLQSFVHPVDHVSHADVRVVGAISPVAVRFSGNISYFSFLHWTTRGG